MIINKRDSLRLNKLGTGDNYSVVPSDELDRKSVETRIICCEYKLGTEGDLTSDPGGPVDGDLNLVIGNDRIPCHKLVLSTYSLVLAKVITEDPQVTDITLPPSLGIQPAVMRAILRFLYSSGIDGKGVEDLAQLTAIKHAAQKLKIPFLVKRCEQLQTQISTALLNEAKPSAVADNIASLAPGAPLTGPQHSADEQSKREVFKVKNEYAESVREASGAHIIKPISEIDLTQMSITNPNRIRYREHIKSCGQRSPLNLNNFDGVIMVDDVKFPIHRSVIDGLSPVLKDTFNRQISLDKMKPKPAPTLVMNENLDIQVQTYLPTVHMPRDYLISPRMMDTILLFAYSKQLDLNVEDLQPLTRACQVLGIPNLEKLVKHYAEICGTGGMGVPNTLIQPPKNLNPGAYFQNNAPMMATIQTIEQPLMPDTNCTHPTLLPIQPMGPIKINQQVSLDSLDFQAFYRFLIHSSSTKHTFENGLEVFNCISQWIMADLKTRVHYLVELLRFLNFDNMSMEELNACYRCCPPELLSFSPALKTIFQRIFARF